MTNHPNLLNDLNGLNDWNVWNAPLQLVASLVDRFRL